MDAQFLAVEFAAIESEVRQHLAALPSTIDGC